MAVSDLWVQQLEKSGQMSFDKINGIINPADLQTKPLDLVTIERHLATMDCQLLQGRADSAPRRRDGRGS